MLSNFSAARRTQAVDKVCRRIFRVAYYSKMDGLDCIWLVDEARKYDQTIDHECLNKFFEIRSIAKARSLYGRGRPQFARLP